MKKRVVLQMEGGLGKQVALTALVPYFKERYEEVIALSSYPDVFTNNPMVYRAISYNTPFAFEEYFKSADDIFYPCGYRESDFRKRRIHLLEAACRCIGIPYDESMKPSLHLTETEDLAIKDLTDKLGNFIIIQAHGAHAPGTPMSTNIMAKDYNLDKMETVVKGIKKLYPSISIINYSLPNEVEIAGTIKMDYNWPIWFGLMRECETFIAIDSSLQHMSAAFDKKGIVLWGATNPNCFGWKHNINMEGACPYNDTHCSRPYFVPSVDLKVNGQIWECPSKACMRFDPESILTEFKKLKIDTSKKPQMDFTKFMSVVSQFVPAPEASK
jgi:hypothetical protein